MSARETLAAMRAIEQAATDGPWMSEWDTSDEWWTIHGQPNPTKGDDRMACPEVATLQHSEDWTADVNFIAASRTFVPKTLAALDAVLAMHAPSKEPTSGHYYCDSDECDRAGEGELRDACQHCGHWFPCATVAAIEQALS